MNPTTTWTTERARVAGLARDRAHDDPELLQARQRLHYLVTRRHLQAALDDPTGITREQRIELVDLLLAGGQR